MDYSSTRNEQGQYQILILCRNISPCVTIYITLRYYRLKNSKSLTVYIASSLQHKLAESVNRANRIDKNLQQKSRVSAVNVCLIRENHFRYRTYSHTSGVSCSSFHYVCYKHNKFETSRKINFLRETIV